MGLLELEEEQGSICSMSMPVVMRSSAFRTFSHADISQRLSLFFLSSFSRFQVWKMTSIFFHKGRATDVDRQTDGRMGMLLALIMNTGLDIPPGNAETGGSLAMVSRSHCGEGACRKSKRVWMRRKGRGLLRNTTIYYHSRRTRMQKDWVVV